MYDAVTGTASPSNHIATAVYTAVKNRLWPASDTMIPANLSPSPVSVTTPTMMPAVAHVAATESTLVEPASSAVHNRRGCSAVSRRMKLVSTASAMA